MIRKYTLAGVAISASLIQAQEKVDENSFDEPIVVTATRLPELISDSNSAVTFFSATELEDRQQDRLQDALNLSSGVIATSTAGQEGQLGTLIVRGLPTRYQQVLIDGVRISDNVGAGLYANILGNLQFNQGENLEVVKGSQGVVHGSGAIGSLVGINNSFEGGNLGLTISQEIGSFEYTRTSVAAKGSTGDLDYYVNGLNSYFEQDLDMPDQSTVRQASVGVRYHVSENHQIDFTARNSSSDLEDSGSLVEFEYNLFSLKSQYQKGDLSSSVVLGYYSQNDDSDFGGFLIQNDFEKWSLTFDNQLNLLDGFYANTGIEVTTNEYDTLSGADFRESDWQTYAVYLTFAQDSDDLFSEVGIRGEYNSEFDALPSAHALVGVKISDDSRTFIKASYANRAPSLLETEEFRNTGGILQQANPDLEEEQVVSLEWSYQTRINEGLQLETSAYANFLNNGITNPLFSTVASSNADGTSEIFGLETSLKGQFESGLQYLVVWNYSARNELLDLPRNTVTADVNYQADKWLAGVGFSHRSSATYGSTTGVADNYSIYRIYGEYDFSDAVKVTARVENLFDEEFITDPFSNIAARGAAGFVGLQVSF